MKINSLVTVIISRQIVSSSNRRKLRLRNKTAKTLLYLLFLQP